MSGKTAVVDRFLNEQFTDSYIPTVENFHRKMYKIRGELYQLDILDTSGNNAFPAARRLQFVTGDLFIVVASVDRECSFEEALRLREEICDLKEDRLANPVPVLIALNKTDLPPSAVQISVKACDERISEIGVLFPCSAKTGAGINGVFAALFVLAKLPKQMLPQQHLLLAPRKSGSASPTAPDRGDPDDDTDPPAPAHSSIPIFRSKKSKERQHPPVSYKEADARRPSLRTDLLVLRTKTSLPTGALLPSTPSPHSPSPSNPHSGGPSAQSKSHKCSVS